MVHGLLRTICHRKEGVMGKCCNCGVEFLDSTSVCPLCRCIVERTEDEEENTPLPVYPYAENEQKKIQFALSIYLFSAIVVEVITVVACVISGTSIWRAVLIAAFMVYGFVTLKFSIQKNTGYRLKMFLQTLLAVLLLVFVDYILGFYGWSLNYVFPSVLLLTDAAILVLMIVNSRNWQSYIPMQLLMVGLCLVSFWLYHMGVVTDIRLAVVAIFVSALIFAGTVIVGGKKARDELYRRFHV